MLHSFECPGLSCHSPALGGQRQPQVGAVAVIYSQVTPQLLQGAVGGAGAAPQPRALAVGFRMASHSLDVFTGVGSLGRSPEAAAPRVPPSLKKTLTLLPIKTLKNAVFKAGVGPSCKETGIPFEVGIMAVLQTQFLQEKGIN